MKSLRIIFFVFIALLVTACGQVAQNTAPAAVPQSVAPQSLIYRNSALGFTLTLPSASWTTPSETDSDPHFYENKECENSDKPDCQSLEIQNADKEFGAGPKATFKSMLIAQQNPAEFDSLISGATVIRYDAPGPAEGWSYEYDVFFEASKKKFVIFTNTLDLEKNVLPTFTLLNSQNSAYENNYMRISLLPGWTASPAKNDSSVNIIRGNYILYINPATAQASGVEGGRFAEISEGAPSADAVVKVQPSEPCGTRETHAALAFHPRVDLYVSEADKKEWCAAPINGSKVWYFSYITDARGSYFNYYKSQPDGTQTGYVITMAYNSKDVNSFPRKGSAELQAMLGEMTDMVKTFEVKQK